MLRVAEYLSLQDFRQRTAASYYRAIRLISVHFGGLDPASLSEEQLRGYFVYLRGERGWAPKSCRQTLAAAKHFYLLTYRGIIGVDYAKGVFRQDLLPCVTEVGRSAVQRIGCAITIGSAPRVGRG